VPTPGEATQETEMPTFYPGPTRAPNGAPYGWPLFMPQSVALPANATTPLTINPRAACWLTSFSYRIFDPAALAAPQITARLVSITVRGEFIWQDQGAVSPFEAAVDAEPRPYKIFRLLRPMLIAPNDAVVFSTAVAAGAPLQIDGLLETYRYISKRKGDPSLGAPA